MESSSKSIFVTVGSTEFDTLVTAVGKENFGVLCQKLGFNKIVIQYGRGSARPELESTFKLTIETYDFKPSLAVRDCFGYILLHASILVLWRLSFQHSSYIVD